MEEKEQLRRQIRLLQGLINDHKNIHGNAPVPPPSRTLRWRNPRQTVFNSQAAFSARYSQQAPRDFQPHPGNSWKKKYSLVNRPPAPVPHLGSNASANTLQAFVSQQSSYAPGPQEAGTEGQVGLTTGGNIVIGIKLPQRTDSALENGNFSEVGSQPGSSGVKVAIAAPKEDGNVLESSDFQSVAQKEDKETSLFVSHSSLYQPVVAGRGDEACRVYQKELGILQTVRVAKSGPKSCDISERAIALKSKPQQLSALPDQESGWVGACKKPISQFLVHGSSEEVMADRNIMKEPQTLGKSEAHASSVQVVTSEACVNPAKSLFAIPQELLSLQRAASTPVSSKASKFRKTNYTWVANPSKCPRAVKRWTSPRASESTRKFSVGAERTAKSLPKGDSGAKQKKSGVHLKLDASPNKYKWKASSIQLPSASKSAFWWQSEGQKEAGVTQVSRANLDFQTVSGAAVGHGGLKSSFSGDALSTYKVKSRTKIIRRKGSCSSPTDKKHNSFPTMHLRSRYSLRKRNSLRGKTAALKKTPPKDLVQITKHRLCRLPASRIHTAAKEGSSLHFLRSPVANKVVQTRYRIVKKHVASPSCSSSFFSIPVPSWKTRRLVTSRSLVLNQMRQSPVGSKSQQLQPRWRNKGFCCIGGVMYRVSANKLSKTSSFPVRGIGLSNKIHNRPARLDCTAGGPSYSPSSCLNRSATSRYIASRAVQRSLAIIRQAKQKKEKKEYCMYYNRFGKCNRGENCPYIHDPEKVAVCTRFLRGTCKKTDGTCSFSHKVSKDKMPVCSYFLKGICNNSDCPYSHVYVSRKAEVCQDFLKGYCPLGEKCKKKHTLVCPDFSKKGICPKGARCKLQHPQRKHHLRQPNTAAHPGQDRLSPNWKSLREEAVRGAAAHLQADGEIPGPSSVEQGEMFWSDTDSPGSGRLPKLPSFISLQTPTSPSEGTRVAERDKTGVETGKPLQIKPRL
ncbi:zinc finger CCCH domain-containing protein 3 [Carettochelys insculpta]|uniref:zinc finger CCCH domain-containing protein 3 n=1 Tax=Carettochelys insculpta TaxID=44489 RepID=UPI003EC02633